jgi:outer membrane protein assembly factor BamB
MRSSRTVTACLALSLLSAACGGTVAFSSRYPDNAPDQVSELLHRLAVAAPRESLPIGVGMTPAPVKLYAYDLAARRVLWQVPVNARFEPFLAGGSVLVQDSDGVNGYDLQSGQRTFSIDVGTRVLNGADGEGSRIVFTATQGLGTLADSEVVLVDDGSTAWRRAFERQAGSPAIVGDTVLVPWGTQFLSALDVKTGEEFARLRIRDGVLSHAIVRDRAVFVGSQHGIAQLTASIGSGTLRGRSFFAAPARKLPGQPVLLRDAYLPKPTQTTDSAQHSIVLAWQPTPADANGKIGMRDATVYVAFYRFVFALDAATLAPRWLHVHKADIVGATAEAGGVAFGDRTGDIGLLDSASGQVAWQSRTGLPTSLVRLPLAATGGAATGAPPDAVALRTQLLAAAQDMDARLVPARLFAVSLLAEMQDAEATANLIALCDDTRMAPPVRKDACTALKQRSVGTEHLLAALERHAAYLQGTTAPPVGALARASATQGEKRAVGPIIAHLKDPGTRSEDLPLMVTALRDLGDPSAVEPLSAFLRLYHADPMDEHLVRALELIPEALVHLSGPVAAEVLEQITYDELGVLGVRERARIALDTLEAQTQAAEAKEADEQSAQAEQATQAAEATQKEAAPDRLTTAVVGQALLPVRDKLSRCLKDATPQAFQARIVVVVQAGKVRMVSVLPESLQGCIEPLVRAQAFPVTGAGDREQISYTLKR